MADPAGIPHMTTQSTSTQPSTAWYCSTNVALGNQRPQPNYARIQVSTWFLTLKCYASTSKSRNGISSSVVRGVQPCLCFMHKPIRRW